MDPVYESSSFLLFVNRHGIISHKTYVFIYDAVRVSHLALSINIFKGPANWTLWGCLILDALLVAYLGGKSAFICSFQVQEAICLILTL